MTVRKPRYSKEEFARRGDEIYQSLVKDQFERDNYGKIIAIDIETGQWEIDKSEIIATSRLEERLGDPQIWIAKIGSRYVRRFGAGRIRKLE